MMKREHFIYWCLAVRQLATTIAYAGTATRGFLLLVITATWRKAQMPICRRRVRIWELLQNSVKTCGGAVVKVGVVIRRLENGCIV